MKVDVMIALGIVAILAVLTWLGFPLSIAEAVTGLAFGFIFGKVLVSAYDLGKLQGQKAQPLIKPEAKPVLPEQREGEISTSIPRQNSETSVGGTLQRVSIEVDRVKGGLVIST